MNTSGFTFIEVLVALLIAALLTGIVCTSLNQVLRTEQRTLELEQAAFLLQTLSTRELLRGLAVDLYPEGAPDPGEGWRATRQDLVPPAAGGLPDQGPVWGWSVWRLEPDSDGGGTPHTLAGLASPALPPGAADTGGQ